MAVRSLSVKPEALERIIMLGMLILTIAGILTALTIYDYQKKVSKIIDEAPDPATAAESQYVYFNLVANYNQFVSQVQFQSFSVALVTILAIILFLMVIASLINSLMLIRFYELALDQYQRSNVRPAAPEVSEAPERAARKGRPP